VTDDSAFKKQVRARMIRRRIGRAAGVSAVAVYGDLDHVRVDIHAARPGVARGHGEAGADRLRAELEELTGKPVQLHLVQEESHPQQGRLTQGPGAPVR
jgi:ribosomal protein S3